jgi:hypothetical protein
LPEWTDVVAISDLVGEGGGAGKECKQDEGRAHGLSPETMINSRNGFDFNEVNDSISSVNWKVS